MKKALLISSHDVLNDIYRLNFKSYLQLDVEICYDLDSLNDLDLQEFDLIVGLSQMEDTDLGLYLSEKCADKNIIILGKKTDTIPTKTLNILPANFNISAVLSCAAKLLGITAQEMAAQEMPDYYSFSIQSLYSLRKSPVTLYMQTRRQEEDPFFVKCLEVGEDLFSKVEEYEASGVSSLYVAAAQRLVLTNHLTGCLMESLDDGECDDQEKLSLLESSFHVVAEALSQDEDAIKQIVGLSQSCVKHLEEVRGNSQSLSSLLDMLLKNDAGYIFTHSVLSCYVAEHIVKNVSWGSEEHVEKINHLLFFHDLFLVPIFAKYPELQSEEDILFDPNISGEDKEVALSHGARIAEVITSMPQSPMGSDIILMQHHGTTNGMGFTIDYKDDISPLAKVIIVSEAYVEIFLAHRDSANEDIIAKLLNKFKRHTYKKMVAALESLSL